MGLPPEVPIGTFTSHGTSHVIYLPCDFPRELLPSMGHLMRLATRCIGDLDPMEHPVGLPMGKSDLREI